MQHDNQESLTDSNGDATQNATDNDSAHSTADEPFADKDSAGETREFPLRAGIRQRSLARQAAEAAAALENQVLANCFLNLDAMFVSQWRESASPADREAAFFRQQALALVRALLLEHLHNAARLEEKAGRRDNLWREKWKALQHISRMEQDH